MKKTTAIRDSMSDRIFGWCNAALLALIMLLIIFPLYFVVIASFSEPRAVATGKVFLWPVGFTLDSYKYVFNESRVWVGYANSVYYTLFGTLFNLLLTIPTGYALSKRDLMGRGIITTFYLIPMYFGGGLIPTYLLVKDLGLLNKPYTLIVLGGLSVYNIIVTRVFFQTSIPESLYESARIEGASELQIFIKIAMPLAKAITAVMALFYAVGRWNSYFSALIYIMKSEYMPLQIVLRNILLLNQNAMANIEEGAMSGAALINITDEEELVQMARRAYIAEAMKYSLIIVAAAPLLAAYPFVQRFFVKGIMIGSLKG